MTITEILNKVFKRVSEVLLKVLRKLNNNPKHTAILSLLFVGWLILGVIELRVDSVWDFIETFITRTLDPIGSHGQLTDSGGYCLIITPAYLIASYLTYRKLV